MQQKAIIVLAVLVAMAASVAGVFYWVSSERGAQTAEATASVISAESEYRNRKHATVVMLSYPTPSGIVQGRARITDVQADEFPAGREVRVCYDPSDTTNVRVTDGPCG